MPPTIRGVKQPSILEGLQFTCSLKIENGKTNLYWL